LFLEFQIFVSTKSRRRFLELSRYAAAIDRGGISEFDEARSGAVTVGFTVAVLDDKLLV
jgi:hypothetical protein